jgi:hypothetical protein
MSDKSDQRMERTWRTNSAKKMPSPSPGGTRGVEAETMWLETELIGLGMTLSESQMKMKVALSESQTTRVALSESQMKMVALSESWMKMEMKRPLTLSESPKTTAEVWSSISLRARGLGMEPATKTELDRSCYTYRKRSIRL